MNDNDGCLPAIVGILFRVLAVILLLGGIRHGWRWAGF